ncbi:MAG: Crp/Fnr family transcriptional regulator [Alphaproteobacteria bacterium]
MPELGISPDQLPKSDWFGSVFSHHCDYTWKDDFLTTIRKHARPVSAGAELMFEGDRVHSVTWVLKGWVGLSKILDDGRRQIIDVILPVDLIAATAANGRCAPYGVTALTDGVMASYSISRLTRQRLEFAPLGDIATRLAAAAAARQSERMLRLGQGNAYERVAHTLLEMFLRLEAIGQTSGNAFRLPMTQREFGDLTGLTSVHVCRTLRRLMHEGMIDYLGQEITIRDMAGLARMGRTDIEALREQIIPAVL